MTSEFQLHFAFAYNVLMYTIYNFCTIDKTRDLLRTSANVREKLDCS